MITTLSKEEKKRLGQALKELIATLYQIRVSPKEYKTTKSGKICVRLKRVDYDGYVKVEIKPGEYVEISGIQYHKIPLPPNLVSLPDIMNYLSIFDSKQTYTDIQVSKEGEDELKLLKLSNDETVIVDIFNKHPYCRLLITAPKSILEPQTMKFGDTKIRL
jgi:hypothetical protein